MRSRDFLQYECVLTPAPAVSATGEAYILAFQIEYLDHILQPPKSAGRD